MILYYFPIAQNTVNKTVSDFFQRCKCLFMNVHIFCYFSVDWSDNSLTRSLIRAFACRLSILWVFSYWLNIVLEFLSLKGGCTGSSKSTRVKMPHCWKSHVPAQLWFCFIFQAIYCLSFANCQNGEVYTENTPCKLEKYSGPALNCIKMQTTKFTSAKLMGKLF